MDGANCFTSFAIHMKKKLYPVGELKRKQRTVPAKWYRVLVHECRTFTHTPAWHVLETNSHYWGNENIGMARPVHHLYLYLSPLYTSVLNPVQYLIYFLPEPQLTLLCFSSLLQQDVLILNHTYLYTDAYDINSRYLCPHGRPGRSRATGLRRVLSLTQTWRFLDISIVDGF